MQLQSWQVCTSSLVGLLIWWIAPTEFGTSSYSHAFVNGNPGTYSRLIGNGNAGSGNLVILNEDAAMYNQAMHNGDIDLSEYSLQDLLGVASNASVDSSSVQFGLTSLQNLLTSSLNLASIFSTKEQPLPLYECFSVSFASESNILQLYFWSYGSKIGGKGSAFWDSPTNATAITAGDFAYVSHLSEPVDRVLPRRCESDLQVSRSRN